MATSTQPKPAGALAIARPVGRCSVTGRAFTPQEKFMAALRETSTGLERVDVAIDAWDAYDKTGLLASWRAHMPDTKEQKPLFVDDNILMELFERLADATEPSKISFRFVLGLILMRKRLLVYESSKTESDGREFWIVRARGSEVMQSMLDPKLDEQHVRDLSGQLGQILSEDAA